MLALCVKSSGKYQKNFVYNYYSVNSQYFIHDIKTELQIYDCDEEEFNEYFRAILKLEDVVKNICNELPDSKYLESKFATGHCAHGNYHEEILYYIKYKNYVFTVSERGVYITTKRDKEYYGGSIRLTIKSTDELNDMVILRNSTLDDIVELSNVLKFLCD